MRRRCYCPACRARAERDYWRIVRATWTDAEAHELTAQADAGPGPRLAERLAPYTLTRKGES